MERYINRRIFLGDPLRKSPPPSTMIKPTVILTAALLYVLSPLSFAVEAAPSSADEKTSAKPLRILCVGDSITAGYTDNPKWNVPFEFGYRQGLFERLQKAGYQISASSVCAVAGGDHRCRQARR